MTVRQLPLAAWLWLQRRGMALPLAGVWFVVAGAVTPYLFHKRHNEQLGQQRTLQALRRQAAAQTAYPAMPAVSPDRLQYDTFRSRLVDHADEAATLHTLFDTARADGLALREGHYHYQRDEADQFLALRIELPIKGSYPSLRSFVRDAMIAVPALSLRELHLKRESVGDTTLTAKLLFVLYERPDAQVASTSESAP
jgi:Tfp pilus assembly protein PilO